MKTERSMSTIDSPKFHVVCALLFAKSALSFCSNEPGAAFKGRGSSLGGFSTSGAVSRAHPGFAHAASARNCTSFPSRSKYKRAGLPSRRLFLNLSLRQSFPAFDKHEWTDRRVSSGISSRVAAAGRFEISL